VYIGPRAWAAIIALACIGAAVLFVVLPRAEEASSALSGRDDVNGATFSLSGTTLTVTVSPSSRVRAFAGQLVRANCVSQRAHDSGIARTVRWTPRSRTLRVHFGKDVGSAPIFCSIDSASLTQRSYHAAAVLT
jgi:hypothetical protein